MEKKITMSRRIGPELLTTGRTRESIIKAMVSMAIDELDIEELKKLINYKEFPDEKRRAFTHISGEFTMINKDE